MLHRLVWDFRPKLGDVAGVMQLLVPGLPGVPGIFAG